MSAYPATTDPTAVVGRRFGAYVIDSIALLAIPAALFFATASIEIWERPTTCAQLEAAGEVSSSETCVDNDDGSNTATINDDEYTATTFKPAAFAIAGGVYLLYLILVEWIIQGLTGATLGKAIFGIRTVDEQGNAPGLGKQFLRGVLWIIPDGFFGGLVAAIAIIASKGHRRVGDMVAKTFVVRSNAKGAPIAVAGLTDSGVGAPAMAGAYATTAAQPATTYAPPAPGTMGTTPPMTAPAPAPTPDPTTPDPTTPDPTTPDPTTEAAVPAPGASGPQWDAARNAYIQWDPTSGRWLTYDDAAAEWKPIDGGQPPAPT